MLESGDSFPTGRDLYRPSAHVETKINEMLESRYWNDLVRIARDRGEARSCLERVVADGRPGLKQRLKTSINPFYDRSEFLSKQRYLYHLKQCYEFLLAAIEDPPGMTQHLLDPKSAREWQPDIEVSLQILEEFFVETQLIQDLSDPEWDLIRLSRRPEYTLSRMIYPMHPV